MTKEELQEQAKALFESHPKTDVFHAVTDGTFFHEEQKNDAASHAKYVGGKVVIMQREFEDFEDEEKNEGKVIALLTEFQNSAAIEIQESEELVTLDLETGEKEEAGDVVEPAKAAKKPTSKK